MLPAASRAAARAAATRAAPLVRRRPRAGRAPPTLVLGRRVALVLGTRPGTWRPGAALALAEARWWRRAALLGGGLVGVRVGVSGQGQGQGCGYG